MTTRAEGPLLSGSGVLSESTVVELHMSRPRVSIVIVSWNSRDLLRDCVATLLELTRTAELEIIVVDNGSTDGSQEMIKLSFPKAILIENDRNLGFARACNLGMKSAASELILLLNSDTFVKDDVVGRCAMHMMQRPDIGMLGCELRYPDGRRQHTANRALGIRQTLFERLWLYKLVPAARRPEMLLGGYWEGDREIAVDWLAGAFLLLRRELYDRSGGFDTRFFMYGEDSEWCMRLRRLGYKIVCAPQLGAVYHVGAASSDLLWTDRERLCRCYAGGIGAYRALNGSRRAKLFRLAELLGAAVRFSIYAGLARIRRTPYYREQAEFFGWLTRFYRDYRPEEWA
jgi:GT2 family glycosyltransferase